MKFLNHNVYYCNHLPVVEIFLVMLQRCRAPLNCIETAMVRRGGNYDEVLALPKHTSLNV